jgi:hypothetical protein
LGGKNENKMSYGITPYLVKISAVASSFGGQDAALKADIVADCGKRMARLDDWFEDTPMADILTDFLAGKVSYPGEGFKYWYVIEMIIQHLGLRLDNGAWYPSDSDPIWSLKGCSMYLLDTAVPIPSPDDFPSVFMVPHARLDEALADGQSKITDPEQLAEFVAWCTKGKDRGLDLVLYYY